VNVREQAAVLVELTAGYAVRREMADFESRQEGQVQLEHPLIHCVEGLSSSARDIDDILLRLPGSGDEL